MDVTILGRTGITVTRTGFGVLPLQRIEMDEAVRILRRAFDAGITFYDTARAYTDSETKIGNAFSEVRDSIVIATKTLAKSRSGVLADLEKSLRELKTDHVDVFQLHNPDTLPDPEDPESAYAGLIEAREKGMTRFIGITNHVRDRAVAAVNSGLYDTLQYPLCHISTPEDLAIIDLCKQANVGLIGMKSLSGGLITKAPAAFAFLRQYEILVPIWGVQRMTELDEILELDSNPPQLDEAMWQVIEQDRRELSSEFCRACGYCMPCPAEIPISMAARMHLVLRRLPYQPYITEEWWEKMHRIENCTECGQCRSRCPYGLDAPALMRKALADYEVFYKEQNG